MLKAINSCLKSLEESYFLTYREVTENTNKLDTLLKDFKKNSTDEKLNKLDILKIARSIESLSIKNDYKLSLLKDFPAYYSNIKLKK